MRKPRLTWDKVHEQYYRGCGYYRTAKGNRRSRIFWLGKVADDAQMRVREIEMAWAKLEAMGYSEWTNEAEMQLVQKGVCQIRRPMLRKPKVEGKDGAIVQPIIKINPTALKRRQTVSGWFDSQGRLKPEHFVDWNKYCLTDLLSKDENLVTLMEQTQVLWNNDPLGTLERLARLGMAPDRNNINIGFNIAGDGGLVFDASKELVGEDARNVSDCDS